EAAAIVRQLERDVHYEVKEKEKSASLTEEGIVRAQELLEIDSFYTPGFEDWPHYLENSIRAYEIYKNDKEYVVEEGEDERRGTKGMEVIIVDDFTGRKMHGRRWSDGLHQAVEVKEGLEPKQETQTLATITFQNYFRMFEKLAGMTGTALTEAGEFHKIYELDVVSVPTNMPVLRHDAADTVYRTEPEKWRAIVEEIERLHEKGQPVLVGTASVDNSEKVSAMLKEAKIPHQVLNAKNNEAEKNAREANIVAKAGERGAVTVATNMAGRGTDIKLGGNFEHRLAEALEAKGLVEGDVEHLEEIDVIRSEVRAQCGLDEQEVLTLGGLYVLGTERHEARRIDNQLRGRSGRQGNAGESRFYLSLQDPLMRIFYRDWVTNAMERLGMSEGQAIESKMVTRAIAKAQRKVEDRNFEIRKSLLEYDEVMNTQRKTIYGVRQAVLEEDLSGPNGLTRVQQMMHNVAERQALVYLDDAPGFGEWIHRTYGFEIDEAVLTKATEKEAKDRDITGVLEAIDARYAERCEELGEELVARVEQYLLLNAIDGKWKDHLYAIDALKTGIGLRGYGQQDPKTIYKQEGTELFHEQLLPAIESEVASLVLRIQVRRPDDEHGEAGAGDGGDGPSGGGDQSLAPKGMVQGVGPGGASPGGQRPGQPTPAQIAAYRKQVNQMAARKAMRQQVPASSAFDLVQRQRGAAPKPAEAPMDFSGTGRNDICPCGSGKKFKKCHGAQ
ncbi:MAG: SEC-C metal-binding domain-containing protein, partial [Planctomycetota bacterium]|nr:SEC-C metal-binding domain-containing protein [Planctomycetota bacterium]